MDTSIHVCKEIFTRKQLGQMYHMDPATVSNILRNSTPDGKLNKYPAYTRETFEAAKDIHYKNATDVYEDDQQFQQPAGTQLDEADLRIKKAKAENLELDLLERKNTLVCRRSAEDFIAFQCGLFAEKLKSIVAPETYNSIMQEMLGRIEEYVEEKGITNIVDDSSQKRMSDSLRDGLLTEDGSVLCLG